MGRYKHGMTGTRIYNIWINMLDRCKNKRPNYGERGIVVCDRWKSFETFYADMGDPPTKRHSIDRIDVNGNYEPGNCRWATRIEQARNTTRNTILELDGEKYTIAKWAEITGIKPATICKRIYAYEWSIEDALTKSVIQKLPQLKPWTKSGMSRSSWYRRSKPNKQLVGVGNRV